MLRKRKDLPRRMNYTEVIQSIVDSSKCKIYLELGCQFGNTPREMIGIAKKVIGVDPYYHPDLPPNGDFFFFYNETTDKFFEWFDESPDVIFIDADHRFENAKRDLENSLKVLSKGGIIFMHDCDPETEELLDYHRCFDTYKVVDWVQENRPDLDLIALPIDDAGLAIIMRKEDRRVKKFT